MLLLLISFALPLLLSGCKPEGSSAEAEERRCMYPDYRCNYIDNRAIPPCSDHGAGSVTDEETCKAACEWEIKEIKKDYVLKKSSPDEPTFDGLCECDHPNATHHTNEKGTGSTSLMDCTTDFPIKDRYKGGLLMPTKGYPPIRPVNFGGGKDVVIDNGICLCLLRSADITSNLQDNIFCAAFVLCVDEANHKTTWSETTPAP
jgi:hypothetical protein